MPDFWLAFGGGLASGIVLVILTTLFRRLLRRRSKGEPVTFSLKELRPLVAVAIGFAMIFIDIFIVSDGGFLMGLGGMLLLWSAMEFLS